jgi:hypothetical protein
MGGVKTVADVPRQRFLECSEGREDDEGKGQRLAVDVKSDLH